MAESYDPNRVHEILVILMLILMVPTVAVAFVYIRSLGAFFSELDGPVSLGDWREPHVERLSACRTGREGGHSGPGGRRRRDG